tara:strand:+ start:139 stop:552 length:414 start_codon:yes stop_codon:yes gene_type:complete
MEEDNKQKALKYRIVDYLEGLCNKSKISNKTIGAYLQGWHIWAPFAMFGGFILHPKILCILYFIAEIILLISFYMFDGCLLTRLEKRLTGSTITFIDPYIELRGLELTNDVRYKISLQVAFLYVITTFIILSYRFFI